MLFFETEKIGWSGEGTSGMNEWPNLTMQRQKKKKKTQFMNAFS